MSYADVDDTSPARLRTISSTFHHQFFGDSPPRNSYSAHPSSVLGSPVRWDEWTHTLESPGGPPRSNESSGAYYGASYDFNPLGDGQNASASSSAEQQHPFQTTPENGQRRRTRSQRNTFGSDEARRETLESPGRLRPSAFRLPAPHSTQSASPAELSRNSPLFPNGLPSPFDQPTTAPHMLTMGAIQPAQPPPQTRRSSPSSSDFDGMDEDTTDQASVYGGDGGVVPVAPTFRSASTPSRTGSQRRQSSISPKKRGTSRKLSNSDRKAICLYREQHPSMKQDHIGEIFGVERSTVSKILKNKEKWLAVQEEDETASALPEEDEDAVSQVSHRYDNTNNSPMPSPVASSMRMSLASNISVASSSHPSRAKAQSADLRESVSSSTAPMPASTPNGDGSRRRACYPEVPMTGGRFQHIDVAVAEWAREQAERGIHLADSDIQQRALDVAVESNPNTNFKASITWLDGFKHRAGIEDGTFLDLLERRKALSTVERYGQMYQHDGHQNSDEQQYAERPSKKKTALASSSKKRAAGRPSQIDVVHAESPSSMDVDVHTPVRMSAQNSIESETTPKTAHRQVAGATSAMPREKENPFLQDGSNTGRTVAMSRSSSRQNPLSASGSFGSINESPFPLQSPFNGQPGSLTQSSPPFAFPGDPRVLPNSGANSPLSLARASQHGRSGSTASSNSVFSTLTTFSSQPTTSTPLTASVYGSFPCSQPGSASLPSTPATGYFGGAFDSQGQNGKGASTQMVMSHSIPTSHQETTPPNAYAAMPGQPVRRATFSGGAPPALQGNGRPGAPAMRQQSSVTFEQAFSSLQLALDFLSSSQGKGIVEADELAALADVQAKMSKSQIVRPATVATDRPSELASARTSAPSPVLGSAGPGPTRNARSSSLSRSTSAIVGSSPSSMSMSAFGNVSGPTIFNGGMSAKQRIKLGRTHSTSSIGTVLSASTSLPASTITRRQQAQAGVYVLQHPSGSSMRGSQDWS